MTFSQTKYRTFSWNLVADYLMRINFFPAGRKFGGSGFNGVCGGNLGGRL